MGKTILVTGKEGFLGNEISQHFLGQGYQVSASVPVQNEGYPSVDQDRAVFLFPWNRRSPVAAKNFVLETLKAFATLDEAWLVIAPERETSSLADLAPLALDDGIDATLKGTVYLVRELLQYQAKHPAFCLHFVFFDEDPAGLPPLAAIQYQGLKGMVSSLFQSARKRHLAVWAYESKGQLASDFAKYVLFSKDLQPGRWNVRGEKTPWGNVLFRKKEST